MTPPERAIVRACVTSSIIRRALPRSPTEVRAMSEAPGVPPSRPFQPCTSGLGGLDALTRLTTRFYQRVPTTLFSLPSSRRCRRITPRTSPTSWRRCSAARSRYYIGRRGGRARGHARMIAHHLGREAHGAATGRGGCSSCSPSADEVGLPDDPEFRSAFVAYLEWGSRLAVINSRPGVPEPAPAPMPQWGWGVPGGPYRPNE